MKKWKKFGILAVILFLSWTAVVSAEEKQTIYNSPFVTFSPDRKAWTANAGDRNYVWYDIGTSFSTGIPSSLPKLQTGEHYYRTARVGEVPVGKWQVIHRAAQCIHNEYPPGLQNFHGIPYGTQKCGRYYYSGWNAYCADCGGSVTDMLIYMSRAAAQSIDYMDLGGSGSDRNSYFYLCPHCSNLEQGVAFAPHSCKAVSKNQYKVHYDANAEGEVYGGYMEDSVHMYDNSTVYDGKAVTPVTHLTVNGFFKTGYEFAGWNTCPDGSGRTFSDKEEVNNLTAADWKYSDTWTEEDRGIVTLYAMWRPSEGTLVIDANGGLYQGKALHTIRGAYGSSYVVDSSAVKAPSGCEVSFMVNGGREIPPVHGKRRLTGWSINEGYLGEWQNPVYRFLGPDKNVDRLTANYGYDAIVLPRAVKPGSSFGGWYYDSKFQRPAGGAGDTITPTRDMTLYAQWGELTLQAENNYSANGGKGAVDLFWAQTDGRDKTYFIYQSRDGKSWAKINGTDDIGNGRSVMENYGYSGEKKSFRAPYAGLYTIEAKGAQGGNYGANKGGLGGLASAKLWLSKGEKVICTVGGQNGYNGGGKGSMFAGGGGSTVVASGQRGTLLIAGGGGGASSMGNGNAGGSAAGIAGSANPLGAAGQSGGAGGGGGYQGGSAGELIVHHHTDACYYKEDLSYYFNNGVNNTIGGWGLTHVRRYVGNNREPWQQDMTEDCLISTGGNKMLYLDVSSFSWGEHVHSVNVAVEVYNRKKQMIYRYAMNAQGEDSQWNQGGSFQKPDGEWSGTPDTFNLKTKLAVDVSGTDAVWISYIIWSSGSNEESGWIPAHYGHTVESVFLTGGIRQKLVCGYTEGEIISSKPAYGGSNYVNTAYAYSVGDKAGVKRGDGEVLISSESIGYMEELSLKGVSATDMAPPEAVSAEKGKLVCEAMEQNGVKISWKEPKDKGTEYYHRAESYQKGSTKLLCHSNVTKNILTSGIKGYYYLVNDEKETKVSAENGVFTRNRNALVTAAEKVQYFHLAAADIAGNISDTVHIRIDGEELLWPLYTRQIVLKEGENVYQAEQNKTWYVRADEETPFTLEYTGYMEGKAASDYQPNYTILEVESEGKQAKNILYTPSHERLESDIRTEAAELSYRTEGESLLRQYPYFYTIRSEGGRCLNSVQSFLLDKKASGKRLEIIPRAGADSGQRASGNQGEVSGGKKAVYSAYAKDKGNGITLIGDGEAPVITGLDGLEDKDLINRGEEKITLYAAAWDALSGVGTFYISIYNSDNAIEKTYLPDEDGSITLEITKDEPVFSGDFTLTAYARDHVGNEMQKSFGATEFALETDVERILDPHDPIFKCGESGILTISTRGYVDRVEVEFPEEMSKLNPALNQVFVYRDSPDYQKEEKLQFMVPLYTPVNSDFTITVRAYKGDKKLEEHPSISVIQVGDTVLEDFRTRLR